jgi:hypothetical protein
MSLRYQLETAGRIQHNVSRKIIRAEESPAYARPYLQ